jgi:predicted RNase H-like HicB family nuclease
VFYSSDADAVINKRVLPGCQFFLLLHKLFLITFRFAKGLEGLFMKYKVNFKKTGEGYAVWVPGLPGCWSQGQTEQEALENIKDALRAYLETVEELTHQSLPVL